MKRILAALVTLCKDFQRAKGLTADGVVGPKTMEKLYEVYLK